MLENEQFALILHEFGHAKIAIQGTQQNFPGNKEEIQCDKFACECMEDSAPLINALEKMKGIVVQYFEKYKTILLLRYENSEKFEEAKDQKLNEINERIVLLKTKR